MIKPIKQWFSLAPYNDEEGRKYHWYNKCYEHSGPRFRLLAGDLQADNEYEYGGDVGPQFSVELALAQEDIPEFYLPDNEDAVYDIHWVTILVWRWGIYLSVRGRVQ